MEETQKFIYRIVCEPKITEDYTDFTSKLVTNLATTRLRAIDDSVISNLRELGKEKNIDFLIAIDESKVLQLVKEHQVLETIKTKECNIHALILHTRRFDTPDGYNALVGDKYKLTEQEYTLIKEWLENGK